MLEGLRAFQTKDYSWKLCFYSTKKSRDGLEMEFGRCEMQDIPGLVQDTILNVLEKGLKNRFVAEYTPLLPKEAIGVLPSTDAMLLEPLSEIRFGIHAAPCYSPEDFMTGVAKSPTGYILQGVKTDENGQVVEQVLFVKRANPFVKATKTRLCVAAKGEITESDVPLLKFAYSLDMLLLGDYCYILSPAVEKDLGFEARSMAIMTKRMAVVAEQGIVSNYEELEKTAYAMKNARKFVNFDREVLEYIVRLPLLERSDFLSRYGLATNEEGFVDTGDGDQSELLIDLLCGRSCIDALGRLSVASNIMPRE